MTCLLAIDTSTEACSVAVSHNGVLHDQFEVIPRQHARRLLPMVQETLEQADLKLRQLDAVAFGCGPGSFTGLRIAAGVAQGLAFGLGVPVIPVSTLAALAKQAAHIHTCDYMFVCLDARIEEVYWAHYKMSGEFPELLGEECLSAPEDVIIPPADEAGEWIASGNGLRYWNALPQALRDQCRQKDDSLLPRASDMVVLAEKIFAQGGGIAPELANPHYLRDKVTQSP